MRRYFKRAGEKQRLTPYYFIVSEFPHYRVCPRTPGSNIRIKYNTVPRDRPSFVSVSCSPSSFLRLAIALPFSPSTPRAFESETATLHPGPLGDSHGPRWQTRRPHRQFFNTIFGDQSPRGKLWPSLKTVCFHAAIYLLAFNRAP